MIPTGPPPRAPGETLGSACRTGQRRRLRAVPFLKALLELHEKIPKRQLEMVAMCRYGVWPTSQGADIWGAMYAGADTSWKKLHWFRTGPAFHLPTL